jgi:hypothetical protein
MRFVFLPKSAPLYSSFSHNQIVNCLQRRLMCSLMICHGKTNRTPFVTGVRNFCVDNKNAGQVLIKAKRVGADEVHRF